MDIYRAAERLMMMDGESWARHANPWSVYSRLIGGTVIFFAIWSAHWIGWWAALPIIGAILWSVLNPRLFPPPRETSSWATRGVLGERVFLNRRAVAIPTEFARMGHVATTVAAVFLAFFCFALWRGDFWLGLCAWHAMMLAKVWFVDRMVCLWDVIKDRDPAYRAWDQGDFSA